MVPFRVAAFRLVAIVVSGLLVADPLLETALAQEAQPEQTQELSKEKFEQLVAPIALYPDSAALSGADGLDLSLWRSSRPRVGRKPIRT